MFGFPSLSKLLVLFLLVAGTLLGLKIVARASAARREAELRSLARRGRASVKAEPPATELVACPRCGTFVPQGGGGACQRSDCPQG